MRKFMYVVIAVSMLASFVAESGGPGFTKFLPDLVSVFLFVYVFIAGVHQQFRYLNGKYWLIFAALGVTIACGPLINDEAVGTVIAGIRYYMRPIPLFLLPIVVDFTERDIEGYLKFTLALCLLQTPVELFQRVSHFSRGEWSGDFVIGTLVQSGFGSLFLIAAMCFLAAMMLRGRMGKFWVGVCFLAMVVAVSINETKVTFMVLPPAIFATFVLGAQRGRRLRVTVQCLGFLAVFSAIFIPVYGSLAKLDDGTPAPGILEFFTDSNAVDKYLNTKAGVGTGKEAGRGDSIKAPFAALGNDPVKITFGLGLGNVSKSSLGDQFTGKYAQLYWIYALWLSATTFIFEIGLLGMVLILLLHGMLLLDAIYVAKNDSKSVFGAVALGYVGAWIVVTIGLFYVDVHLSEAISFMFWFFSGLIAARRKRLASRRSAVSTVRPAGMVSMKPSIGRTA